MAMLSQLFGKPKISADVEFWHAPERAGWLMKQGEYFRVSKLFKSSMRSFERGTETWTWLSFYFSGEYIKNWRRRYYFCYKFVLICVFKFCWGDLGFITVVTL